MRCFLLLEGFNTLLDFCHKKIGYILVNLLLPKNQKSVIIYE